MKIEQIYTGCIAEAAYYITSGNEAAIVDPLREIQPYLERLERDKVTLKYIFETHFHADFVSGHVDLARATGATIVYGPTTMETGFKMHTGHDGEVFQLGNTTIKLIHTPGHTMESSCYLVHNDDGSEHGIITGDTLFIGDVGRPDLAQHVISDLTERKLASHLYDSLRNKIMPLSDDLIVYPNHGAGSACGKNMSKETTDTLGNQKRTNYALNPALNREEFIEALLTGLTPPPAYFPQNVLMNIQGYASAEEVKERSLVYLSPAEFEQRAELTEAVIVDTRGAQAFHQGFVPQSINIGIDGDFAPWAGTLLVDTKHPILLVTESGREEESIQRLSRVGFDHVVGILDGGFDQWKAEKRPIDTVHRISADEFAKQFKEKESVVIDVRKNTEYESEHVVNAINKPLAYINEWFSSLENEKPFYLHCAGGYRSMIAASILKKRGIHNFIEIEGGMKAIGATDVSKTNYVCPSTLA